MNLLSNLHSFSLFIHPFLAQVDIDSMDQVVEEVQNASAGMLLGTTCQVYWRYKYAGSKSSRLSNHINKDLPREAEHYLFVGSWWKHRVLRDLEWKHRLFIQFLWNPYFSRRKPVFIRRNPQENDGLSENTRLFGQNPSFFQKHRVSWLGCSFQQFSVLWVYR